MEYTFIIEGSYDGKNKNPLGYRRRTFGSKWNQRSIEYENWKQYVRECFYKNQRFKLNKPFQEERGKVSVEIFFKDERHVDPDNLVKGILDSLWDNDKHVDVETQTHCRSEKPIIKVLIQTYEQ